MGLYNSHGLYAGYDKEHKIREENDLYCTPPSEVYNILNRLDYDFTGQTILEPCYGRGHMIDGIDRYLDENNIKPATRLGTEYKERGYQNSNWQLTSGIDFLEDDYPIDKADVIIMNPPFKNLEPFLIRALEIAQDKLIVLTRSRATEGKGRYEKIYSSNPPSLIIQYIDRIQCWKDGVEPKGTGVESYNWIVWDKKDTSGITKFDWIWSVKH